MNFSDIITENTSKLDAMSDKDKHLILQFIYFWLSGNFMGQKNTRNLQKWKNISEILPPKVGPTVNLYRLVTLPIKWAKKTEFIINPAPGRVSSWSSSMIGIDSVAGIANERVGQRYADKDSARIAIQATLPGNLVLATPKTIKEIVTEISKDYFDKYPEKIVQHTKYGQTYSAIEHENWPKYSHENFTRDDVGFMSDVVNRPGGWYKQYECVVETPPKIHAKVVRIYRLGTKILRVGNDDPHN